MDDRIEARITPEIFREFAWFDMVRVQKRCRAPLLFALIMAAFAVICFLAADRVGGAGLLGGVLLGAGLVLPLGWLLSFYLSVRGEAKKLRLAQAPVAYVLHLTDRGLEATREKEHSQCSWERMQQVCRLKRCICLYAAPRRAFLLPDAGLRDADRLWRDICQRVPDKKVQDLRH